MARKKKPFIDKKNASTYHLLQRSQRDVAGNGIGVVLWPSPGNSKTLDAVVAPKIAKLDDWRSKIEEAGLVDEYDYEKHLRPITGTGMFLDEHGKQENALLDPRSRELIDNSVQEVSRQLDSVALTPDCMDDDIAQALFGDFDEEDFEEIADDFCVTAAQEPSESSNADDFDFDAHIKSLLKSATKEEGLGEVGGIELESHRWGRRDAEFFASLDESSATQLPDSSKSDGYPPAASRLSEDEERALCDKFETTLAEYESDEIGELESVNSDTHARIDLHGNCMDPLLDDYLNSRNDGIGKSSNELQGVREKKGGFHVLQQEECDSEHGALPTLNQVQDALLAPEMELPPEEILIDGESYFTSRTRNPWDCESILSTYSNLGNNPVTLDSRRRRGRRKTKQKTANNTVDVNQQIKLSSKTGLPIDFDRNCVSSNCDLTFSVRTMAGERRSKSETAEEKKSRKNATKKTRMAIRIQKKMVKEAFQEENSKLARSSDLSGVSVFKC